MTADILSHGSGHHTALRDYWLSVPWNRPARVKLNPAVDPERDHIVGSPDAPVTLVEYGDFECPFCARPCPRCAGDPARSRCERVSASFRGSGSALDRGAVVGHTHFDGCSNVERGSRGRAHAGQDL
jgi:hypothetical protein